MGEARKALLADRGVISVAGDDAETFLQGLITGDMALLSAQPAIHAALLTPQGKILFEFFVAKAGGRFILETGRDQTAGLIKRLALYKLRAKIDIRDASSEHAVFAIWGGGSEPARGPEPAIAYLDPRLSALGLRVVAQASAAGTAVAVGARNAGLEDYDAHRIALGVPEAGKDYVLNDTFPHEANFDLLNGVSFGKGCFVGQEVVSRMQHRGTARKRIVIIEGQGPLQPGSEVRAGEANIGITGSAAGTYALALLRLDRVDEAEAKGQPITAGGMTITVRRPAYMPDAAKAPAQ